MSTISNMKKLSTLVLVLAVTGTLVASTASAAAATKKCTSKQLNTLYSRVITINNYLAAYAINELDGEVAVKGIRQSSAQQNVVLQLKYVESYKLSKSTADDLKNKIISSEIQLKKAFKACKHKFGIDTGKNKIVSLIPNSSGTEAWPSGHSPFLTFPDVSTELLNSTPASSNLNNCTNVSRNFISVLYSNNILAPGLDPNISIPESGWLLRNLSNCDIKATSEVEIDCGRRKTDPVEIEYPGKNLAKVTYVFRLKPYEIKHASDAEITNYAFGMIEGCIKYNITKGGVHVRSAPVITSVSIG